MSEQLANLATTYYGNSPTEVLDEDGPFPIVGTGGVYGQANRAMFSGPAVVVPRKGSLGNPQFDARALLAGRYHLRPRSQQRG